MPWQKYGLVTVTRVIATDLRNGNCNWQKKIVTVKVSDSNVRYCAEQKIQRASIQWEFGMHRNAVYQDKS